MLDGNVNHDRTGAAFPRWPSRWAGWERVLVALLLATFLFVGWQGRRPLALRGSDELIYLSLSHALESGSYRQGYVVGHPLHVQYPPGYPAWLVLVRNVLGENHDNIRIVNFLLVAAGLFLIYRVARQLAGRWPALGTLALLSTTPLLADWSGSLMSDALFLLLSTVSLVEAFFAERDGRSAIPAIIAGWLAFLTRTAGLALLVALALWLWRQSRRREILILGIGSILIMGAWFGYTGLVPNDPFARSYGADLAVAGGGSGETGLLPLAKRVWHAAQTYAIAELPAGLSLPLISGTVADNLFWLAVVITLLVVGVIVLWRSWMPAAVYLVTYGLMLVWWPWVYSRLLFPILPLMVLTMILAARHLTARLPARIGPVTLGLFISLLGVGTLRGFRDYARRYRGCDRSHSLQSAPCYPSDVRGFVAGAEYIASRSAAGDVIATSEPVTVNYLTDRLAVPSSTIRRMPPDQVPKVLRDLNVRFVLLTGIRRTEVALGRALLRSCQEFRIAARFEPLTLVLATSGQGPEACPALGWFINETSRRYGIQNLNR